MARLSRPWSGAILPHDQPFSPDHCLISEHGPKVPYGEETAVLMRGNARGQDTHLCLHPYPKKPSASKPDRIGFLSRPNPGLDPGNAEDLAALDALRRMNEVLARVQELEEALDDPAEVWPRLRAAWHRAENEKKPRMAEIVRQAGELSPIVRDLETRIRRVLRRTRQLTPLDRVQEMDRTSMVWLSRQPGSTVAERAGSTQRILATVRQEDFNTLENRVLHAYVKLAAVAVREWLLEHDKARNSDRYRLVETFGKLCTRISRELRNLGIAVASTDITPNYVLMQERSYRRVHKAWLRLLKRDREIDDLWAWQAQTWTDFAVLAIVLALDELDESVLVAQSPIVWQTEATTGRCFDQDRPFAVFWLRETGRIVEVQARPETPGSLLTLARAHVALRITDPSRMDIPRRVAVWTPHAMNAIDLEEEIDQPLQLLSQIDRTAQFEILRNGLILTPGHGASSHITRQMARVQVDAIALGASGKPLADGLAALGRFARGEIFREQH